MYFAIALWAYFVSSPWNAVSSGAGVAEKRMASIAVCFPLTAFVSFFVIIFDHFIPPVGSLFVVN